MEKYKKIYCPRCGRKVMKVRVNGTMEMFAKCKKCYRRVSYSPNFGEVVSTKIPERSTSSGMMFY